MISIVFYFLIASHSFTTANVLTFGNDVHSVPHHGLVTHEDQNYSAAHEAPAVIACMSQNFHQLVSVYFPLGFLEKLQQHVFNVHPDLQRPLLSHSFLQKYYFAAPPSKVWNNNYVSPYQGYSGKVTLLLL